MSRVKLMKHFELKNLAQIQFITIQAHEPMYIY
jgi:hypothetical protein